MKAKTDAQTSTHKIPHLASDAISMIALCLSGDVYGANGDFRREEIRKRVIDNIHRTTGHTYVERGVMPVWAVADLIMGVWEYMDRKYVELLSQDGDEPLGGQP